MSDSELGYLRQQKRGSWQGSVSDFWGSAEVQLLLDADESGPSADQRALIRELRENGIVPRDRIEAAIRALIATTRDLTAPATNPLRLSTIFIPRNLSSQTWRVWYDLEAEAVYWFGAEVKPDGEVIAFCED